MDLTWEISMNNPLPLSVGVVLLAATTMAGGVWAQAQQGQNSQAQPAPAATSSSTAQPAKDAQNGAASKKVYTNEDLKATPGGDASGTGNAKTQKLPATGSRTKYDHRDQAYWHSRAQKLRSQIDDVDRQIAQIKASVPQNSTTAGGGTAATGTTPIYYGGQYARLKSLEARKATLDKQMEDLEEEARKAEVPPGWLR